MPARRPDHSSPPPNRDFIRVGRSGIEGRGVFAKRKIPRGTRIIEYTGEHLPIDRPYPAPGDGNPRVYTFALNDTTVIDGSRGGNDARYVNHSCDPNCDPYVFDNRAYIYAMRDIVRG